MCVHTSYWIDHLVFAEGAVTSRALFVIEEFSVANFFLLYRLCSMLCSRLIIVGVGLLGSSLGLAVKKRNLAGTVLGIGDCVESLSIALRLGAVDTFSVGFDSVIGGDDSLAVICTPVNVIAECAFKIASVNDTILISDVGSTKTNICASLDSLGCRFVGGHPIAGGERSGPDFGDADLFQGRLTVLTPTSSSRSDDVERLRFFWESLGSHIICMEPAQHDAVLARTSHLPHALAAALALCVDESEHVFCGTGFADTTRIASGSPSIWTDIFMENRENLLFALERFGSRLDELRTFLCDGDEAAIAQFLSAAASRRGERSGV